MGATFPTVFFLLRLCRFCVVFKTSHRLLKNSESTQRAWNPKGWAAYRVRGTGLYAVARFKKKMRFSFGIFDVNDDMLMIYGWWAYDWIYLYLYIFVYMIIWCWNSEVDIHSGLLPNLFEANDILFVFAPWGGVQASQTFTDPCRFAIGRLFKGGDSFVVVVV